jgi:selenocysteine lyase/cysteine desulfurase
MDSRRGFIQKAGIALGAYVLGDLTIPKIQNDLNSLNSQYSKKLPSELAKDESFWNEIRHMYTVSPSIINLNNGGVCPQPLVVQEAVERYNRLSNEAPSYYMWRILDQGREPLRAKLASIAGVSPEEIAINRNASESLETIIFGLTLQAGDEVVLSKQDYPNMINAWKQRAHREGIILKWLDFQYPIENEDQIANVYTDAFTSRTKVVHITHMVNWCGQILPVQKIARVAKQQGIKVIVDGAHTFAHLDFKISDLDCDYFGTSLHKWLCAPFGSGMLYVRKEEIGPIYPLFSWTDPLSEDIRKFESLGTRSFAIEQAIGQACDFHMMIGIQRKQQRLQYLKNYWAEEAVKWDRVSMGTSLDPNFGCAIGLLQIEGKKPVEVSQILFRKFKIHTVGINWDGISGVRITPHVYTIKYDLDRLLEGIQYVLKND